ncbi:hypothetical protein ASZ90_017722 [hydrocarbon metagenome]|uniref:Uncharacterized protein n=1 Tax=hydrocarbon metagenome TaxID=938273 RepID=A0A0W8E888_9ZZZZ
MLKFLKNGLLPPGDHEISLLDLEKCIREGPGKGQTWDKTWRLDLLQEFKRRYQQLLAVGIKEVYIDGSYATDKFRPNDMDVYFVVPRRTWRSGAEQALKDMDPEFWRFETELHEDGKVAYPMAFHHHIEMFPVYLEHTPDFAVCQELIDPKIKFFRTDKHSHRTKGIIKIQEVPS